MIKIKTPAFSLAEALITLLIVCLITLASIPVLTKKKRTAANGSHGTWMCAYKSDGTLVHWSSSDPQGDINNPEGWASGCKFVPPVNISTFNITAIGAGGKGGDGISELELVADGSKNSSYTPKETGFYRVLVVGGGGGGGRGRHRDYHYGNCYTGDCGAGGSGASGAYVIADVTLHANKTYALVKGAGGTESVCAHGTCSRPDYTRGGTGGTSSIYSQDDNKMSLNIWAKGGEGGQRITTGGSGWCKDNCGGGKGGEKKRTGMYSVKSDSDETPIVASGNGNSGKTGGCGATKAVEGGTGFNAAPFGINQNGLGAGGHGGAPNLQQNGCPDAAGAGTDGTVLIYKIVRKQGNGGKAAVPEEKMSMSVKGRIDIKIGRIISKDAEVVKTNGVFDAEKYKDIRTTTVEIFDKAGRSTKKITSRPGDDDSYTERNGEASYWTEDGGGLAAKASCTESGQVPVYEGAEETRYEPVCKKIKCIISIENPISGYRLDTNTESSATKIIKEEVDVIKYNTLSEAVIQNYVSKMSSAYFNEFFKNTTTGAIDYKAIYNARDTYFRSDDEDLQGYYNYEIARSGYPKLKDSNQRCFVDTKYGLKYEKRCADDLGPDEQPHTIEVTPPSAAIIGHRANYVCEPAGNAKTTAFGAGGGGGYAHTIPGFGSKGGYGASGAVIIEW